MKSVNRTILVAGMGTYPAVLTETVWALAHHVYLVVSDEIVIVTRKRCRVPDPTTCLRRILATLTKTVQLSPTRCGIANSSLRWR